jgi:ribonuclease/clavin/mitogillin
MKNILKKNGLGIFSSMLRLFRETLGKEKTSKKLTKLSKKNQFTVNVMCILMIEGRAKNRVLMLKRRPDHKNFPGYLDFPVGKLKLKNLDPALFYPEDKEAHKKDFLKKHLIKRLFHKVYIFIDGFTHQVFMKEVGFDLLRAIAYAKIKSDFLGMGTLLDVAPYNHLTYFYLGKVKQIQKIWPNEQEIEEVYWKTPEEFLKQHQKGNCLMMPGNLEVLKLLQQGKFEDTDDRFIGKFINEDEEIPCLEPLPGLFQLLPDSCTFPPFRKTNCFVFGDVDDGKKRFVVDPSPVNEKEYEKLKIHLQGYSITDIFITHHHIDHHQFSADLAREFSIPVTMSAYTHQRILQKQGEDYFKDVEVIHAKEGDILTIWNKKNVRVYETPGHDEGHLSLAPDNLHWFLVGDLIQGFGTVFIGRDDGDMEKYFESLKRVIELNPKVVLSSHGLAMGSINRLEETLKHRVFRENQILKLHREGKTPEQMLRIIYRYEDKRLWPLALESIQSHLLKLNNEK